MIRLGDFVAMTPPPHFVVFVVSIERMLFGTTSCVYLIGCLLVGMGHRWVAGTHLVLASFVMLMVS